MSAQQFERYEDFGATIQDVTAQRVFYQHLEKWRALKVEHGVDHVPWPRDADSLPDPKSQPLPPWRKKGSFKAPEPVPVLPKVKKLSMEIRRWKGSRLSCLTWQCTLMRPLVVAGATCYGQVGMHRSGATPRNAAAPALLPVHTYNAAGAMISNLECVEDRWVF